MTPQNGGRPAGKLSRALCVLGAALVLAACSDGADNPAPASRTPSPTVPVVVPTFPPTWTPTFTPTPGPPTPLPTASPTATVPPTLDPVALCQEFVLLWFPSDGVRVDHEGRVAFSWQGVPDTTSLTEQVRVVHRATGTGIQIEWQAQEALNMPVEMDYLSEDGVYDWTFVLHHEALGDLCPITGWFERKTEAESPTRTPTPTATPTVEPTQSGTPDDALTPSPTPDA